MNLEDRRSLSALLSAGLTTVGLGRHLRLYLQRDLQLITTRTDVREVADLVIDVAVAEGWDRPLLQSLTYAVDLDPVAIELFRRLGALTHAHQCMLDTLDPVTSTIALSEALSQASRRIFSVEIDGRHEGTAFLVGPDIAITNYHVIESLLTEGVATPGSAARAKARFDFTSDEAPGKRYAFAEDWHVAGSGHHDLDCVPGDHAGSNFTDALDFAILRLAQEVGHTAAPGSPTLRGWYGMASHAVEPTTEQRVYVFGHPHGRPLMHDDGRILWVNDNATRLRYRLNTTHGVSGGPCLDNEMNLVAIHSSGDPANGMAGRRATYNQGVPIAAVVAKLRQASLGHLCLDRHDGATILTCIEPNEPVLDRETLQRAVVDMCAPGGRRVLLVDGTEGSGRQFARSIIRKLAENRSQVCILLSLEALAVGGPSEVCRWLALELGADPNEVPSCPADRQATRWAKLLAAWIAGKARLRHERTDRPLWIVVDCVGDVVLTEGVRELLAEIVERVFEMPELRVVVIGGGHLLPSRQRERALRERLVPIVPGDVSRYLLALPTTGSNDLTPEEAAAVADAVFAELAVEGHGRWEKLIADVRTLQETLMGVNDGP